MISVKDGLYNHGTIFGLMMNNIS